VSIETRIKSDMYQERVSHMGYTHYWKINEVRGNAVENETNYLKALKDCQRIVKAYYKDNGGLSGYSAHTKLGQYGGLNVNGKGEDAHEDFIMREHFNENDGFNFCKTARKPYDLVVVACLAVLKHRLKDSFKVSSDGDAKNWREGVEYARKITGLAIKNPLDIPHGEKSLDF
jgi:hypothetical protein